jgi:integrase
MIKHRARGEGSIRQLSNGRWKAELRINGGRLAHYSKSQQDARDWIRKIQGQVDQGLSYDDERITLGAFMQGWLGNKKLQVRMATIEQYNSIVKTYLQPNLGRIRLRDLSSGQVQDFYDHLSASGKGTRTIRLAHVVLHGCLEQAKRLGLIHRNPTEFCALPRQAEKDLQIWDEDQVTQFLNFIRGHKNEHLYYLALGTGMRRGELLGLQWKDINWNKSQILVRRECFHPAGGGFIFQAPKTKLGKRSIQLGRGVVDHLRAQLQLIDLERNIARDSWQNNDLVFPSLAGTPIQADRISHEFPALTKLAGLPVIRFHDCRHTAASIMLSHGIPPVIVAGMLGHSLSILMTTYAHYIPGSQDEAAQVMDDILSPIPIDLRDLEKR